MSSAAAAALDAVFARLQQITVVGGYQTDIGARIGRGHDYRYRDADLAGALPWAALVPLTRSRGLSERGDAAVDRLEAAIEVHVSVVDYVGAMLAIEADVREALAYRSALEWAGVLVGLEISSVDYGADPDARGGRVAVMSIGLSLALASAGGSR